MSILVVDQKRKFCSIIATLQLMKEINRIFNSFLNDWPSEDNSQFFVANVPLNF